MSALGYIGVTLLIIGVMLVIARVLAQNAIATAIEHERAERLFERQKREEDERAEREKRRINADLAAEDAKIDAMAPKELEGKLNE